MLLFFNWDAITWINFILELLFLSLFIVKVEIVGGHLKTTKAKIIVQGDYLLLHCFSESFGPSKHVFSIATINKSMKFICRFHFFPSILNWLPYMYIKSFLLEIFSLIKKYEYSLFRKDKPEGYFDIFFPLCSN